MPAVESTESSLFSRCRLGRFGTFCLLGAVAAAGCSDPLRVATQGSGGATGNGDVASAGGVSSAGGASTLPGGLGIAGPLGGTGAGGIVGSAGAPTVGGSLGSVGGSLGSQDSNCRNDIDCGPGGSCSPSQNGVLCFCPSTALCGPDDQCMAGNTPVSCACGDSCGHGYFCHTPDDTCVDDSDCRNQDTCNYDRLNKLWSCSYCWPHSIVL
jgi:hypothetical protein